MSAFVVDKIHLVAISTKVALVRLILWQCDLSVGKGKNGFGKRDNVANFFKRNSSAGTVFYVIYN